MTHDATTVDQAEHGDGAERTPQGKRPTRHRVIAYHQTHRDDEGVVDLSAFGDTAPLTHLIVAVRIVGTGQELSHERVGGHLDNAGWDFIALDGVSDPDLIDPLCTVIELELESELTVRLGHTRD